MNRRLLLLPVLLAVAACAPAGEPAQAVASSAAPSSSPALSPPLADGWPDVPPEGIAQHPHMTSHEALAPATVSLRAIDDGVRALPADNLAQAREAAAVIVSECPYNRSLVQLPVVMQLVLARHDDPGLAKLKQAVDLQVSVLDQLGVAALPLPRAGAYLDRDMPGLATAAHLASRVDPIGETRLLTDQIEGLVEAYDPGTTARIDAASEVLSLATQGQWALKGQLAGQREALRQLSAETTDPALKADLDGLEQLISDVMALYC